MLRTHTCGQLRITDINKEVTLTGWVQRTRDKGSLLWIDLRDRYGITQLFLEEGKTDASLLKIARETGREYVLKVSGLVVERLSKNDKMPTGDVEVKVSSLEILNASKVPPFTIEDNTDGGDDLRMKYRYLDLRRNAVRENLQLRHKMAQQTRIYLDSLNFIEVETPVLIKSTPEGARDFVVPSRMNPGEFYALPQSPQTFKQLLMVSGFDRYYQIVKCFRDEDLRADRQPEFTQIDCEMAFITQEDILSTFEGLVRHLFKTVKGIDMPSVPHMSYDDAMKYYGSDKPDTRFDMKFVELNSVAQGKGFQVFDSAELVVGICAKGCAEYTRKQLDELTEFVKKPQIGAKGLVYVQCKADGSYKSSVDKFYSADDLKKWAELMNGQAGDLLLIMSGETDAVRKQLGSLRLIVAKNIFKPLSIVNRSNKGSQNDSFYSIRVDGRSNITEQQLKEIAGNQNVKEIKLIKFENGLINAIIDQEIKLDKTIIERTVKLTSKGSTRTKLHYFIFTKGFDTATFIRNEIEKVINPFQKNKFSALWVIDFPLLEWNEEINRWHAMHHPFTSPKPDDMHLLDSDPGKVRANAYDMVINGTEVGGGSIRIHDRTTQQLMFSKLGFSDEEAKKQFGFLMDAFEFGAPPHGGIAFGFDRLCSLFGGSDSIRDFIAFPKNNSGRDMMIDTPSTISAEQLKELSIDVKIKP